ncbi:MAG TPA: succinylglutamate desuccinylase/aspartoacylase family protein, partial [Armatimonadota bacterium]|nr:succinylglutamate desuccinylase/aspartoacylase family protein [Armatimonadota bacterium]
GNPEGNDIERIAFAIDREVFSRCDHYVDMHCWNHFWAAATLAGRNYEGARLMGEATTTRFIMWRDSTPATTHPAMSSQIMFERGGVAICIELAGQFQIVERQVLMGLQSMVNVAKVLGMLEGDPELIEGPRAAISAETSHEVHAPCTGLFVGAGLIPDDYVQAGQLLGHIISDRDLETVEIVAPVSGYLWKYGCHRPICDASLPDQHPYADEGDMLALVVTV